MRYYSQIKFLPFYAVSVLPMSVLYLISAVLFYVVYYVKGYRKQIVRENLRKAFPYKGQMELAQIEKKFYRHFCDIAIESVKTLTINENEIKKRLVVRNPNLIRHYLDRQESILLYTAHQDNWEWLVYLSLYFKYPSYTFYRPLQKEGTL